MNGVKDFYDHHSEKYEKFETEALLNYEKYPLLFAIRNRERGLLSNASGKKVLYFATGSGSDILHLTKLGAKIVTIDFSLEMINRTMARFKKENVDFELLKNQPLTKQTLDEFFTGKKQVLILHADINQASFPRDYFDYCFCYCTLPHLGEEIEETLKKLVTAAKNGAVSVYEKESLPELSNYYNSVGFKSEASDRTIKIQGGFVYHCTPPETVKKIIQSQRKLEIIHIGLGNIFNWSSIQNK
jgi:ubiquinone/menaquinone biosynthesis C-methylase UbiE